LRLALKNVYNISLLLYWAALGRRKINEAVSCGVANFLRRRDVVWHNKNLFKILDLLLLAKIETPAVPREAPFAHTPAQRPEIGPSNYILGAAGRVINYYVRRLGKAPFPVKKAARQNVMLRKMGNFKLWSLRKRFFKREISRTHICMFLMHKWHADP
jgi:hypothetical protein